LCSAFRCSATQIRLSALLVVLAAGSGCGFLTPVVARSDRLIVRARGLAPGVAEALLAAAQEVRADLSEDFSKDPADTLTILIVDRTESNGYYTPSEFLLGDCVVLGRDKAEAVTKTMRPLLHHEMTHFFVRQTLGSVSRWYNEGLAELLCYRRSWSGDEIGDLAWHVEELDSALLEKLVRTTPEAFYDLDVRASSSTTTFQFSSVDFTIGTKPGQDTTYEYPAGDVHRIPFAELPADVRGRTDMAAVQAIFSLIFERLQKQYPFRFVSKRIYRPDRHYTLARLVLASLDTVGWNVTGADPSERILADPEIVLAAVQSYTEKVFMAVVKKAATTPDASNALRRDLAEALCKTLADLDGAAALLAALVEDADPSIRDRAALALFTRGDRAYAEWVKDVYAAFAPALAGDGTTAAKDLRFVCLLDSAIAEFTGGVRNPDEVEQYLEAHLEELPPQVARPR
jgi:hypothetical protein